MRLLKYLYNVNKMLPVRLLLHERIHNLQANHEAWYFIFFIYKIFTLWEPLTKGSSEVSPEKWVT